MRNEAINRYRQYMPVGDDTCVITLNESYAPDSGVQPSRMIHPNIEIWLKYEGLNPLAPSGRGMTMAITKAVEGAARP